MPARMRGKLIMNSQHYLIISLTISSSMSSSLHGPNTGGFSTNIKINVIAISFSSKHCVSLSSGLCCPVGRWMGVPETTTEEERPWYPTGRWSLDENEERGGREEVVI